MWVERLFPLCVTQLRIMWPVKWPAEARASVLALCLAFLLYHVLFQITSSSLRSCGSGNVLWGFVSVHKLCHNGCTWKAFPQCASSCDAANDQKKRKCSCTGYICLAFLLYASSSCELSNHQFECWNTRTLCICEAFPQSGFFCAASERLNKLKHNHIDCTYVVSPQCVS